MDQEDIEFDDEVDTPESLPDPGGRRGRGNPGIGVHGAIAAAEKRAQSDDRLARAKLEIEAEIDLNTTVEGGRVTAQMVLSRAGLKPHFLGKPSRKRTNDALRIWIGEQNERIGKAARKAASVGGEELAIQALRADFVRLQNEYVKDYLKGIARLAELKKAKLRVADLEAENDRLRGRFPKSRRSRDSSSMA